MSVKESLQAFFAALMVLLALLFLAIAVSIPPASNETSPIVPAATPRIPSYPLSEEALVNRLRHWASESLQYDWAFYNKPLDWESYMIKWEAQSGIPFEVQAAVMNQESGGQPILPRPDKIADTLTGGHPGGKRYPAVGLFQVIPYHTRFDLQNENPFDPDINAREAFRWLAGCNEYWADRLGTPSGWGDDKPILLYNTFACYHGGATGEAWGAKTEDYANNVTHTVFRARNSLPPTPISYGNVQPMATTPEPPIAIPEQDDNFCFETGVICKLDLDMTDIHNEIDQNLVWIAGWHLRHPADFDNLRQSNTERDKRIISIAECLRMFRSANGCI